MHAWQTAMWVMRIHWRKQCFGAFAPKKYSVSTNVCLVRVSDTFSKKMVRIRFSFLHGDATPVMSASRCRVGLGVGWAGC